MRIVETDNYGGDYPNEVFLNIPFLSEADAKTITGIINFSSPPDSPRYWMVVPNDYVLRPGFEP